MKNIYNLILFFIICNSSIIKRIFKSKNLESTSLNTKKLENEILKTTNDINFTRQIIELKNGMLFLTIYPPLEKKIYYENLLDNICQNKTLALKAFNTALNLQDFDFQCMGLYGLAHLRDLNSIKKFMNIIKRNNDLTGLASYLLSSQLAQFAPVNGENGFIEIFKTFYGNKPKEPYFGWNLLPYMWELLRIVDENPSKFSDTDFEVIMNIATNYGSKLFKNDKEDFNKFLNILTEHKNKRLVIK